MEVLQYALLGLGTGAVLGLLGLGLVVIFRGAGVVNLAQGAYAMLGAFICWDLHDGGWPIALAIVVSILLVALLGFLTDQIVLRRLRTASPLARLIATAGMLLLIQSSVALHWGVVPKSFDPILPSSTIDLGNNVTLPADRVWLLGIAAVLTAVIGLAWRYTRLGWVAEAVSESPRLAATQGWSTEVVSGLTWAVGTGLAAAAGILVAPLTQLDTTTMPALVVPALAAALVAQFRLFSVVFVGAVGIGVVQSLVGRFVHITGASDAVPFFIIIIVMFVAGTALPLRGHSADRLPHVGSGVIRWRLVLPACAAVIGALLLIDSLDWLAALAATFAIATILLSFVVVIGYTGQVSLAQLTLAGAGGLLAARLAAYAGVPFAFALLAGGAGSALIGSVIAVPALRTRGVNLTIITLGLAVAGQSLIFNSSLAGDFNGIALPSITVFGLGVDPVTYPQRYAIMAFVVLVLVALFTAHLRRTPVGRMLLAVRENERAAAASGINVMLAKLIGFAVAGAIAGLGGVLLSFATPVATFAGNTFDPITGLNYLVEAVIGGIGFILGGFLGSTLAPASAGSILALHWQEATRYIPLVGSLLLLLTLATNPDGWVYQGRVLVSRLTRGRRHASRGRPVEAAPDDDMPSESAGATADAVLEVGSLSVTYGGVRAVDNVSMTVRSGRILGLIGPNGSGKTSLMDAVTGFVRPSGGTISVNGEAIGRTQAYRRARLGMTRSFQNLELYEDMTVAEHVLTAADAHRPLPLLKSFFTRTDAIPRRVAETLKDFELWEHRDQLPNELSYGRRRLLSVARAMATGGNILLIDEPVGGLDEEESKEFAMVIRRLARERGTAILVIEHDMPFIMSLCDEIVVIEFGKHVVTGTPEEIRTDVAAIAAYLGESDQTDDDASSPLLVTADDVTSRGIRRDLNL